MCDCQEALTKQEDDLKQTEIGAKSPLEFFLKRLETQLLLESFIKKQEDINKIYLDIFTLTVNILLSLQFVLIYIKVHLFCLSLRAESPIDRHSPSSSSYESSVECSNITHQ